MLVAGFPAEAFGTNCYLLATGPGEQCLVVDPGIGVLDRLEAVLTEHRLRPAAVLLTHGHLDHTFSVAPVCGARGITAYIHPGDRDLLADPAKGLSGNLRDLLGDSLPQRFRSGSQASPQRFWSGSQASPYTEPDDVAELPDGGTIEIAGLAVTVDHAPGHTRGSVLFRLPDQEGGVCLSGDVLFAGSIGRTDLPGGSMPQMLSSLRDKILPLPDETTVLPGHGPVTTIGRERATNPYLRQVVEYMTT